MEKLLNVKEAAEFLNVSQMTVRRWTNSGSLSCYRVGGRHERRFKTEDLYDYLKRETAPTEPGPLALGFGSFAVPDGSHLTHLCLDSGEGLEIGSSYLLQGLVDDETVLLVASDLEMGKYLGTLQAKGIDVESSRKRGKLLLSQGMDTPTNQAGYLAQTMAETRGRFRLLGDMSWAKQKGWSVRSLRQLEEIANASPASVGRLILCQYSLDSCSGQVAMMAFETHRYIIYSRELKESPYFKKTL